MSPTHPAVPSSEPARRPLPKAVKAAVLALISALVALAALEVAVRVLRLDVSSADALRYHPRFGWTLDPDSDRTSGVGDLGFRHPPVPLAKPPGVRRLVVLGDSFARGAAYPYEATFAGLLGEWLGGERWQVINLGVSGWGTGQQYLALREIGMAYRPDAVVLQTLPFNDLCNNTLALAHACDTEDSYRPYFVIGDDGDLQRTWDQPWRARLRRSALFRLLERRLPALAPPAPEPVGDGLARSRAALDFHRRHAEAAGLEHRVGLYTLLSEESQPLAMREAWAVTDRLVGEIAALTEEAGIPLIAVAVPFADSFDEGWLERAGRPGEWPRAAGGLRLHPALGTARMECLLEAHGATVIPMYTHLLAGPMAPADHFHPYGKPSDRHFNALGHWRLASWVIEELNRLGLTAARPPDAAIDRADLLAGTGQPAAERSLTRPARGKDGELRRVGLGPQSRIAFLSDEEGTPIRLKLAARPRGGTEAIGVVANGEPVGELELVKGEAATAEVEFAAVAGRNVIRLVYRGWREDGPAAAAVVVTELTLECGEPNGSL